MEVILDILKFTIPGLIVFLTVYFMLKKYFEHQTYVLQVESSKQNKIQTIPMKMQAYERLALFLERIRIHHLMFRLQSKDMSCKEICDTLMIGVQQEYEHNMVQQIYVSQKLWEIIILAKNEVLHELSEVSLQFSAKNDKEALQHYLSTHSHQQTDKSIETALFAIKSELQLML